MTRRRRRVIAVVEVGLVAGYLIAWAVRKAKRVGGRMDAEVDAALDTGLDRLHEVVAGALGADPAVAKLVAAAEAGEPVSERTQRRVGDAVAEAVEGDRRFSEALEAVLAELARVEAAGGRDGSVAMTARATGQADRLAGCDHRVSLAEPDQALLPRGGS